LRFSSLSINLGLAFLALSFSQSSSKCFIFCIKTLVKRLTAPLTLIYRRSEPQRSFLSAWFLSSPSLVLLT
jgi:hypothetical protein